MSPISSIGSGISPLSLKLPSLGEGSKSSSDGSDFGSVLKQAVGALGQLGAKADASSLALAKGDPIDIHEVMLNTEQASLGFSMALQVRNKLIDAYQEIMKTSV
jgi:flagellar hook-basal body complex protein FliE